ncbi:MAG: ArsA family ATPase [Deltaproteobacteria bacterium]|nr:ArsA family ATPase [Deltaproteobacteria bacterium]
MSQIIDALVRERRVLCVVGPGGVGKTTIAAALGVCAAAAGRRVLLITIDPARRLATAMGLDEIGQSEREVRIPAQAGLPELTLNAMMLDLKYAWDDMVRRLANSDRQREAILGNQFYRHLSTSLAGAQEYIACEHLYTLCTERSYDLIVLDTPPSAHAIDFFEAPGRVLDVLENDAIKLLLAPSLVAGRASLRLLDLGGRYVLKVLSRLVGMEMLHALAEFLLAFEGMYPHARDRTQGFRRIFASPTTAFLVVATPTRQALAEACELSRRLERDGLRLGALVINQIRTPVDDLPEPDAVERLLAQEAGAARAERLTRATFEVVRQRNHRAAVEREAVANTLDRLPPYPRVFVSRLADDVHDIETLIGVARELCSTSARADGAAT